MKICEGLELNRATFMSDVRGLRHVRPLTEGARDADGNSLKVGDHVGFKSDVEQYGKIKKIRGSGSRAQLTLVPLGSGTFEGDYIGGQRVHDVIAGDVDID